MIKILNSAGKSVSYARLVCAHYGFEYVEDITFGWKCHSSPFINFQGTNFQTEIHEHALLYNTCPILYQEHCIFSKVTTDQIYHEYLSNRNVGLNYYGILNHKSL